MNGLKICIHRAADTIGGNCIEIVAPGGERILLDAGRPLETPSHEATPLPPTLDSTVPVLGILLSHAHADHHGMLEELPESWPLYCGRATEDLLKVHAATMGKVVKQSCQHWHSGQKLTIGPFIITPHLIDHSAFDAYVLQIEAAGKTIIYSGDFRAHGRKAKLTYAFLRNPPKPVDVLIMEGTNLSNSESASKPTVTEELLEKDFVRLFKETKGRVFVSWSVTNIDRTVTLYRACLKSKRTLVPDLYAMHALMCLGQYAKLPQPGLSSGHMKAVVTSKMLKLLERMGIPNLVDNLKQHHAAIKAETLIKNPARWVIMARDSLVDNYKSKGIEPNSDDVWVWSQWKGYLQNDSTQKMREYFAPCRQEYIHTSGHASSGALQDFANALQPKMLIPVHGENWPLWADKFENCHKLDNGEWLII